MAVAACSSSSAADTAASTSPSVVSCPSPPSTGDPLPAGAASRVPHPVFAQSPRRLPVTTKGESEVQFTTPIPLHDAAAFVQREYPAAGYRITGGDAEAHEADIVWAHGATAGKTKLSQSGGCATRWTVLALPAGSKLTDQDKNKD